MLAPVKRNLIQWFKKNDLKSFLSWFNDLKNDLKSFFITYRIVGFNGMEIPLNTEISLMST